MSWSTIKFLTILSISAMAFTNTQAAEEKSLKSLAIVFRHGDRTPTPTEMYPNDPYYKYNFPGGLGVLTDNGRARALNLGKSLREEYDIFLDSFVYSEKTVIARSTDSNRTKETLRIMLKGLYPLQNTQDLPVTVVPNGHDSVLRPRETPEYKKLSQELKNNPEIEEKIQKFENYMSNLTRITGKEITTPDDLSQLYHILKAESMMGLALPEWTKSEFPTGKLRDGALLYYDLYSFTLPLRKFNGGKLVRELVEKFESVKTGVSEGRVLLYSAHEDILVGLLKNLNIYEPHVPDYTNALILEFHETEDQHFIKIYYYNGLSKLFALKKIPRCDELCLKSTILRIKLFRHGDRTPNANEMYPKDPNYNYNFPGGLGQLTPRGKLRAYEVGESLRERYNDFLGDIYSPKDVFAESSNFDRTKMSLQLIFAALYPPKSVQVWNDDLNWQPISFFHTMDNDTLLNPGENTEFENERKRLYQEFPEIKAQIDDFDDYMKELSDRTSKNISRVDLLFRLYGGLMAATSMNLSMPESVRTILTDEKFLEAVNLYMKITSYTKKMRRLNGGNLLEQIIERMKTVEKNLTKNYEKFVLYSGHEFTVYALLQNLGIPQTHVPDFSSAVLLELHEIQNRHYVKVFYYDGLSRQFTVQQLPSCGESCTLDDFERLANDLVLSDDQETVGECMCRSSKIIIYECSLKHTFLYLDIL
ncbi:hypothetical protein QAD02_006454 [Eretmocerus hayati]|uniref:Uncharacterized protein n=1 Tax=Eretmocerus hayati TaxID=131215 RepID=A0ACC2N198_9HYME|nr:hypothetical protein QAD02_006454 [Eretmocerus hayati]